MIGSLVPGASGSRAFDSLKGDADFPEMLKTVEMMRIMRGIPAESFKRERYGEVSVGSRWVLPLASAIHEPIRLLISAAMLVALVRIAIIRNSPQPRGDGTLFA